MREAVGQHRVVGRAPARAAAFEQGRLEPAAMLVGAFEIEVGAAALLGPVAAFQREDVGAAAVEPDVEDVGDHLVIVGVAVAEEVRGVRLRPRRRRRRSLTASTMRPLTSGSTSSSPVFRSTNSAIGTPQARWRLITQSGRPSTIDPSRLRPFSGTKRVLAMAVIASCRSVGVCSIAPPSLSQRCSAKLSQCQAGSGRSIAMNHCGVQR